jgi:hypothetical protein
LDLTVTELETLAVGRCKYEAFRIKQEAKRAGHQVDVWSALYSPDLDGALAKVYDEGTSEETTIAYDYIQSLSR